jgi:tRNA A37 threonylcarbamoyladenosine synthetase subunit TsaC/SUA5/YrdC
VFILNTLLGTEKALGLRRRELGVRLPGHPVPLAVINTLASPLYSITAKRTMLAGTAGFDDDEDTGAEAVDSLSMPPIPEEDLFEGGWELEDITGLDLILDPGEEQQRIFSTILDLCGDEVRVIRRGAGPWPV